MARIFMDGFETGDFSLWTSSVTAIISSSVPVGFSGTYYASAQSYGYFSKTLSNSKSELYFAFKMNVSDSSSNSIFFLKDSGGTSSLSLLRNVGSSFFEVRLGAYNGSLIATGSIPIGVGKTNLIEIRYKPLNSGGIFTTKINGVQDIDYSGDTTNGLENISVFSFGNTQTYGLFYIDDFVVDDANWIGNTKLGIIVPDGTGTTNNWTASAGNAWDCLNEIPPVDTDYAYSNTTNQISTYAMTTIANMNTVKSIQLQGRAAYEGSPTPTKIQLGVRASGADYFATDLSPSVSFGMLSRILELNPADSAAFEQADIDALEVGVKAVA